MSPNTLLTMKFYPLSIPLTIITLNNIISNFPLAISPASPMTQIVLIKVLTPLLFVLMQNNTLSLLPLTPLQTYLFQTLPSSSNVIVNTNPTTNQNFPAFTSQTTTTTENLSTSHTPNQYTTPSNTPPVIPSNSVKLPVYQILTIPPIPFSLNNTLSTQPPTQNPPI